MEKIYALITKLQELRETQAGLSTLSYHTQLLYAEIMRVKSETRQQEIHAKINVSVILPAGLHEESDRLLVTPLPEISISSSGKIEEATGLTSIHQPQKEVVQKFSYPSVSEITAYRENVPPSTPTVKPWNNGKKGMESQERKEINEMIVNGETSINDRLKQNQEELAERLSTMQVKDLQDAIALNDKFLFINELFRGDQDMYDRSIKTINRFSCLREAEYWIERELKIKLSWLEENELVKGFYLVVRKRFPLI